VPIVTWEAYDYEPVIQAELAGAAVSHPLMTTEEPYIKETE
jgi:hypothetical protein